MYLQSSLILVVSVTLATGQQKSYNDPIEPGQNYCKTIEEAVNYLRGRDILEDINLDFLRDIAYVETKDGEGLVTTNDTINRGLWNINEKQRSYLCDQFYCKRVEEVLVNEFTCGSSYEQPMSAATAALAYIIIALFDFDDNRIDKNLVSTMFNNQYNSSWQLYRLYSNNTNVSQEWFDNRTRALRDPTEQYCFSCENIESKGDVIVLMDSSGSVGDGNFEIAKRFMVNLASHLNLGPNAYKFGVITYSSLLQDRVPLSDDIGHLNDSIMAIPYTSGGTLTGAAIYHAVSKFEPDSGFGGRSKGEGVNRILIVATDGKSGDSVSEPSEYASNNSIEVFSIGIGSNVNEEELRTIAKEPHHVFHVDTYEHLFQLSLVIQTATCRSRVHISPTNGNESLHLNITEGKVFFAQIMISESRLQECNNEGKNAINLNITVTNGEIVVYGSFEIEFPDSKNYDYNWTIGSGQNVSPQFEVNTHDHCSGSKRRRQIDNDNQVFYMAIQSGNTSVTLDIDTSIGPLNEENLLAVIVTKVTDTEAEGLLSYHCIANCTCPDAYVVWERDSINPALPTAAKAVTSSNNRETTLNLFTNTLGYSGGFYCYIRSPSVIGTFGERIEVNLKCQNGHAINNIYCLCDPGWRGDFCGQAICTTPCSNSGTCVSPDHCECTEEWTGTTCTTKGLRLPTKRGSLGWSVEKPDVVVAVLVPVMLVVGLGVAIGLLIALVVWRWRKQKGKHNVEATEEAPGERRLSRRISKQLYKLTSKGRLSLSSTMSPSMEYLNKPGEDDIPEEGENEVESDCESKEQEQPEDTSEDNTEA